jgi:hypothetical protein
MYLNSIQWNLNLVVRIKVEPKFICMFAKFWIDVSYTVIHTYIQTYGIWRIQTIYTHTYIHTYVNIHTWIHTYIHTYIHTCGVWTRCVGGVSVHRSSSQASRSSSYLWVCVCARAQILDSGDAFCTWVGWFGGFSSNVLNWWRIRREAFVGSTHKRDWRSQLRGWGLGSSQA